MKYSKLISILSEPIKILDPSLASGPFSPDFAEEMIESAKRAKHCVKICKALRIPIKTTHAIGCIAYGEPLRYYIGVDMRKRCTELSYSEALALLKSYMDGWETVLLRQSEYNDMLRKMLSSDAVIFKKPRFASDPVDVDALRSILELLEKTEKLGIKIEEIERNDDRFFVFARGDGVIRLGIPKYFARSTEYEDVRNEIRKLFRRGGR